MDRNALRGQSVQSGPCRPIRSRRELEFLLAQPWPHPERARRRTTRLDWWVNAAAILIMVLVAVFLAYEVHDKGVAQVEWLSIAVRMLAYDKPL